MPQQTDAQIQAKADAAKTDAADRVRWEPELKPIVEDLIDSKINNNKINAVEGVAGLNAEGKLPFTLLDDAEGTDGQVIKKVAGFWEAADEEAVAASTLDAVTTAGNFTLNSMRSGAGGFEVRNTTNSTQLGLFHNVSNDTSELYIPQPASGKAATLSYDSLLFTRTSYFSQQIKPYATPGFAATFTLPNVTANKIIPVSVQVGATVYNADAEGIIDLGTVEGTADSIQNHIAGATVMVTNGVNVLYVNPAATLAALEITLPATPHASNEIYIFFGGTVVSGDVVTAIDIIPNAGQTLLQASIPSNIEAGECIAYKYNSSLYKWFRK